MTSQAQTVIGGVNLGGLPNYLFFFANGSTKANWQGATKGFAGNVAIDGIQANETTSGGVPFAGTIYTNASSLGAWAGIVDQNDPGQVNPAQAFGVLNQTTLISNLETELSNAFAQINGLPVSAGFSSVSSTSLNGLNKQNGVAETFVVNVTSGLSISTKINVTGDAGDVFILRWDSDANFGNGYQGTVKFQSGGAIVPLGGLKPSSFIHVAGNLNSSGGGTTPAAPYPQGVKLNDGTGATIVNGSNFSGGGFFTGYWLTTGDPVSGETSPFSNGIFVGGWYTTTNKFSMTSGTSGVYVAPPPPPAQVCTPPAAAPECTPPTTWNVDKVVTGTQDWQSLTGVSADNVTNKIRLTGSGTVIVNNKDLLLKSSGAVVFVNGPTLIVNNGNLKTEVAGARFIMTNGTLRTYGNFQQSPNSVVCITNSTVDIGEEQAGVNFTSQTSTSADFQNDGGYRYLNTVCMNVTHDFQLQSTGSGTGLNGVDVIINSCIEIGDRGLNHATPTSFGNSDGDDSGNWQNNNRQSIYGTDIVVANGSYQNSIGVMTLCDVDIKVNKSGSLQNNSGSIVGQNVCVAVEDIFENSGTWTATLEHWFSFKNNSTNVPGAGGETSQSTALQCFTPCCAVGQTGSLGDCVWNDTNQNGVKDSGENGVPNVSVQLRNCQDQVLQTTQTNASGIYGFTNLQAGCYRVCVVKPSGYTFSPQNVGSDATDSDVAAANGCTADIDLSPGENDPTND
ncbi:MAG: SdrD B-like domain-containing protein, partial [Acidobacteriota bacterium]